MPHTASSSAPAHSAPNTALLDRGRCRSRCLLGGDDHGGRDYRHNWGDSFNLSQEFVVLNQGKGFAAWAWLFAQTKLAKQPAKPTTIQIVRDDQRKLRLKASDADLKGARVLWEADGAEPAFGPEFTLPS